LLAPNSSVSEDTPADPQEAAENAGLTYVSDLEPGIRRKKCRSGFGYFGVSGTKIHDKAILKRIRKLAIPPAWTDVWICSKRNGHLQATGRDAKGRKQYRYHPAFREVRDTTNRRVRQEPAGDPRQGEGAHGTERPFARQSAGDDCRPHGSDAHPCRQRQLREGEQELWLDHVAQPARRGQRVRVDVSLQGQRRQDLAITGARSAHREDRSRVPGAARAGAVSIFRRKRRAQERDLLRCEFLLARNHRKGDQREDFRTLHGTVLAALALHEVEGFEGKAALKRNIKAAIEQVAARLGNTVTICRKCYVHPEILQAYAEGQLSLQIKDEAEQEARKDRLTPQESAVVAFLEERLSRTLRDKLEESLS
jgi:DNA topoisomerase I